MNSDNCRCECKELIVKVRCDDGFVRNPSICNVNVITRVMFENIYIMKSFRLIDKRRKRLIDKLVKECDEDIDGNEMVYNATLNDYGTVWKSCTLYIVLLIIAFIIIMGISGACFYFYWHSIKNCFNKLSY